MNDVAENDKNPLDDLLTRMPEIAKAVAAFPEGVQQSAFDALIAAATGAPAAPGQQLESGDRTAIPPGGKRKKSSPRRKRPAARGEAGTAKGGPRRTVGAQPKVVRELDLRPKGKKSFSDFVKEKNPTSNHDKNVVTLYYLANIAQINPVNRDQVYTAYREMGWKLPPDFSNALRLTASKKRYLDTKDADDLRLLNPGLNRVEQDLPQKKS